MSAPDPNCSNCNGTGKIAAVMLDLHGDGQHDCFCVTHDQGPQHPEDMTREEVNAEVLAWRTGELYRGYDRIKALEHEKCKDHTNDLTLERIRTELKEKDWKIAELQSIIRELPQSRAVLDSKEAPKS